MTDSDDVRESEAIGYEGLLQHWAAVVDGKKGTITTSLRSLTICHSPIRLRCAAFSRNRELNVVEEPLA